MKIVSKKKIWFSLSTAIIVIGLIMGVLQGFNLGIDFTGGTMMQVYLGKTVSVNEIKEVISEFDLDAEIIHAGDKKEEIIIKTKKDLNADKRQEVFEVLKAKYNLKEKEPRQAEQFGPSMGSEIQRKAWISIGIAALGMLIYITIRFEIKFGLSAILALLHDILIVLSIFAIFKIPLNSSFVAAMLTIVGYSINDTIVVFDRIRENLRYTKKKNYGEIVDMSINQTITRTINTSLTTLGMIIVLYIVGVESIKAFTLPLIIGTAIGTYSSIFIASPIWVTLKEFESRKSGYNPR